MPWPLSALTCSRIGRRDAVAACSRAAILSEFAGSTPAEARRPALALAGEGLGPPEAPGAGRGGGAGDEDQVEEAIGGAAGAPRVREVEGARGAGAGGRRRVPARAVGRGHAARPALTGSTPRRQTALNPDPDETRSFRCRA